MSDNPFHQLDGWLQHILGRVSPQQLRNLASRAATQLRTANQKRIAAQTNPDGSAFAPRSSAASALRRHRGALRRAMFARLRLAAHLKAAATAEGARVGFAGRTAAIARVHHHGLRDRVSSRSNLEVQYPKRELLGLSAADIGQLHDLLLLHVASK